MEIKIGIRDIAREVSIESSMSSDEVAEQLRKALSAGDVLELTDEKGRRVLVPAQQVAYLDLGQENARAVGFGAF